MSAPAPPWPALGVDAERFRDPPREYGILPFWFLNGELDPEEMRFQLREFRAKGMPGIILHGRYGLERPYIGPDYLERIRLAVEEAERLELKTWVYDEMNWPSGTADKRVLRERPDLAQRYIECINFTVRGPWFAYLTGEDSRYLDFERSTPVAAFALGDGGELIDLTPNLSFEKVIPWQAPAGDWRIVYIVEKRADYYIDALNPESTAEFLRIGYEPYVAAVDGKVGSQVPGFYTDEPAMHYYLSAADVPIVPWTKDMFRRFRERNGYELRPRLPHLFFDLGAESARVRFDFYTSLTEFYSDAYYRQIHEWCRAHGVLFTGHLLYEEWLRQMIRVEGNIFRHYRHLDVVGVDHLYPVVGDRDDPAQHVAIKLASSAAHQLGSERLLCESFGGMFMDATMQRMKWITDWEYVLGVNLLNPHGFHYTLEGPRKRDWPPSMFYQYPWWRYYGDFSAYVSRLSYLLTGGRHVARAAVLWPIASMFANYTPQARNRLDERTETDFNVLTDMLLRLHHDFDYFDEEVLAEAELDGGVLRVGDEEHALLILPPVTHVRLGTVERLERFVAAGGRVLALVFLPDRAFGPDGVVDVSERVRGLFGVDPRETQSSFAEAEGIELVAQSHEAGGRTVFVRTHALARLLPRRRQREFGPDASARVSVDDGRHWLVAPDGTRRDISAEVAAERAEVEQAVARAVASLIEPDVVIDNAELLCLHRVKDDRDLYFVVNPTRDVQSAEIAVGGDMEPVLWDPSTGNRAPLAPSRAEDGRTRFRLSLPPVGSALVLAEPTRGARVVETNVELESVEAGTLRAHGAVEEAVVVVALPDGGEERLTARGEPVREPVVLDGEWEFEAQDQNALVLGDWLSTAQADGAGTDEYAAAEVDTDAWLQLVPGAWAYQQPAEPDVPYPFPVWYRATFEADEVPPAIDLVVDGFAGSEWRLYVNGEAVTADARRSPFDSQMKVVEIAPHVRRGTNVVAVRLTLTGPTDGLLDLLKLIGDFGVRGRDAADVLVGVPRAVAAADWTKQGFPYFSGCGVYRRRVDLPPDVVGKRLVLEAHAGDDVLEVRVNGVSAGVRLWPPYAVDVSDVVRPGGNELELRVANTPANLLERTRRRSGLTGPPRLVVSNRFELVLPR